MSVACTNEEKEGVKKKRQPSHYSVVREKTKKIKRSQPSWAKANPHESQTQFEHVIITEPNPLQKSFPKEKEERNEEKTCWETEDTIKGHYDSEQRGT
jgi:hypothetical protein